MKQQTVTLEMIAQGLNSLRQEVADTRQEVRDTKQSLRQELAETKQSLTQELADTRECLDKRMTRVERKMATKLDVAELRQDLSSFRHENQKAHVDLYAVFREEMYEHLGTPRS